MRGEEILESGAVSLREGLRGHQGERCFNEKKDETKPRSLIHEGADGKVKKEGQKTPRKKKTQKANPVGKSETVLLKVTCNRKAKDTRVI